MSRTIPLSPCRTCGQLGAFSSIETTASATCDHLFGPIRAGGVQGCSRCGHSHRVRWDARITCLDVADREARRVCRQCEAPLEGRRTVYCSEACSLEFDRNHFWTPARAHAIRLAHHLCARDGCGADHRRERLEVNHIIPVVGADRSIGCFNHQGNLEALCHTHHVEVTNEQRRSRHATKRSDRQRPGFYRVVGPLVKG